MRPNYVSDLEVVAPKGFGLAMLANIGTAEKPEFERLPVYRDENGTLWFAGKVGQRYGIELIRPVDERRKIVLAVDGCNVLKRIPTPGLPREGGYIPTGPTEPGANVLPGWPDADFKTVDVFVFTDPGESLSKVEGFGAENCGVVAGKFYFEAPSEEPRSTRSTGEKSLGTGAGETAKFETPKAKFRVDVYREPDEVLIRYATEETILAKGYTKVSG